MLEEGLPWRKLIFYGPTFYFELPVYTFCTNFWFSKCAPPWIFPPLDTPFEYWIEHVNVGLLCFMFKFFTRIFYRRVPGFANDCLCGVWCSGLTTCFLYDDPLFGKQVCNGYGFVRLTQWRTKFSLFCLCFTYILTPHTMIFHFRLP